MDTSISEESFFYFRYSKTKKIFFSVDGKRVNNSIPKHIHIEKIKQYPDVYEYIDVMDDLQFRKEALESVENDMALYKKVLNEYSSKDMIVLDYSDSNNPEFYYSRTTKKTGNKKIYDYRFYFSATDLKKLVDLGVAKSARSKAEKIAKRDDADPFDFGRGERFSQTNVYMKYSSKMKKLEARLHVLLKSICGLEERRKKIECRIQPPNSEEIRRIKKERRDLLNQYLDHIHGFNKKEILKDDGAIPGDSFNDFPNISGDILLTKLGIKDKASFRTWMKANHPDKHQSSPHIAKINILFARALNAARNKGYI